MVEASLNIFDLGVIIVIGLSALLSFFRGFVREVLSLGAWLGAGIITLYSFPAVSKWLLPQVKSEMVASGLASMGVFICSLILLSILLGVLLKFLKPGSEVGFLDNFIGLFFGLARGVLVVSVVAGEALLGFIGASLPAFRVGGDVFPFHRFFVPLLVPTVVLAGRGTGYSVVYHLEIALLFATLVAMGPLVRRRKAADARFAEMDCGVYPPRTPVRYGAASICASEMLP